VDVDHAPGTRDDTFRPNQILAVGGLPVSLIDGERSQRIVDAVERRLLTPIGLRSLAPGEPGYAPRYEGDSSARDAVYHQGTVWPWLMGPFVDAWVRVRGNTSQVRREARTRFVDPLLTNLCSAGLGHVSEIAEAEEPFEPLAYNVLADLADIVWVSSSLPIRDIESYFPLTERHVRFLANRGANGIDGVVSTVLGAAASRPGCPTVGLVGDLALLHDAGALLGAALRELSCVMVVVDNDGGGIFSFLPQASALAADDFERLFATPHGLDLAGLARLHGLATSEVERIDELDRAVQAGFKTGAMTVIVVRTEQRANVRVHDELHAAVAAALDGLGRRAG